ncbi:hypothetical protein C8R45DRAFT_1016805 [Mycena sanguinolenta]|nr:hypothetical protein C8R45DRAFT_1016805 [Mycena sanguinolenta]
MALARLSSIPLELQYLASNDLGPSDLLALSQVSTYWRAFVLGDKRWAEWFTAIVSYSNETLEQCLTRFNILDKVTPRQMVYLCLRESCALCGECASKLYLPHMKRVCGTCLQGDDFTVLQYAPTLAKYDLRERDVQFTRLLTLEWINPNRTSKRPLKLVSESRVKEIAVRNCAGSESLLNTILEQKKAAARRTYTARSEDYRSAVSTREALQEKGNVEAAEAVVLAHTGRKVPKAFPTYPPILLPVKAVDRDVVCFAPRRMAEVGGKVVVDVGDESEEGGDDGSGA